ncbi:MAG: hypothetical protein B7X34_00425 [Acidobacteriia bacterium 12-62-4]|nr:MAG: hypothetical protein B7X34_00425 [Acidobacteriia bacterium 12-62-4]
MLAGSWYWKVLEAEVPVLHVRQPVALGAVIVDTLTVGEIRNLVGQGSGEVRIGVRQVSDGRFGKRHLSVAAVHNDVSVVAERAAEAEAVRDSRGVVDAVAAAEDKLIGHRVGEAKLRRDLLPVGVLEAAAVAVLGEDERAGPVASRRVRGGEVDGRHATGNFDEATDHLPSNAEVEGQLAGDLPIVLEVEAGSAPPVAGVHGHDAAAGGGVVAE